MAAMTWNTLNAAKTVNGAIQRWVNYDKLDPEEAIAEAEDWMALYLRTSFMQQRVETDDPLTLAEGESSIDILAELPDFLDPLTFFLVGQGYLGYVAQDEIDKLRWPDPDDLTLNTGPPTRYAIVGHTMLFDVEADADYTIIGNYYGKPTALSASNQTSIYTDRYRLIFKEALLARAYQMAKDPKMQDFHEKEALRWIGQQKVQDDLMLRAQEQMMRVS